MPQSPITNFFLDQGDRYIGEKDANNTNVVPSLQYILVNGVFVPVSIANPMPATVSNFPAIQQVDPTDEPARELGQVTVKPLPAGTAIIGKTGIDPAANGVKNVDGTGAELFTVANPAQVKLQSSGPTGSAAPANAALVGGKDPSGILHAHQLNAAKELLTANALQGNAVRTILVDNAPPLDFKTPKPKTAGQTFDVPHTAKYKGAATFDTPTTFTSEASTAGYTALANPSDGLWFQGSGSYSVNGQYAQQLYSFDLLNHLKLAGYIPQSWDAATLQARLKYIGLSWIGYGVGSNAAVSANGATVKAWTGSAWAQWGTNTASVPNTVAASTNGGFATYVDSNGIFHLLAHSTYPSDGTIASTIFTDYISVAVQFYGDYANNGDALSQGKAGSAAPPVVQQVGGRDAAGLLQPFQVDAVKNQLVGLRNSAGGEPTISGFTDTVNGPPGLATYSFAMLFNGATWDRFRVANKAARVTFTSATSAAFPTPAANKKHNPFRITLVGITPGEKVDIKDGATVIRTKAADAQGNVEVSWPDCGTAGRAAAANNVFSAAWTTAVTGSASIIYDEE